MQNKGELVSVEFGYNNVIGNLYNSVYYKNKAATAAAITYRKRYSGSRTSAKGMMTYQNMH